MTPEEKREKRRIAKRKYWAKNRERLLERHRANALAYYYANLEERREAVKKYHEAHADERRAYRQKRWAESHELLKTKQQEQYKKHREKRLQYASVKRLQNPDAYRAYDRRQYRKHKERILAYNHIRRARIYNNPRNDLTAAQWRMVQEAQKHCCAYCGEKWKGKLTRDHITPVTQNGPNTLHNIVAACASCNNKKRTGPPLSPVQPLLL